MLIDLSGRSALVCGSSQGIGAASAKMLAELGCQVTCLARNEDNLKNIVSGLKGSNHHLIAADVGERTELSQKIQNHINEYGPFEILINNSGGPPGGPIASAEAEAFQDAFEKHLLANALLASLVIPGMKDKKFGRIVNIISTSVKAPLTGLGVSNTIRGAVANWSKTLSNELASFGITVNNVLPGATETQRLSSIITNKAKKVGCSEDEMAKRMRNEIPAKRFGKPEEVAAAIGFLCSPAAAYINGINIPVDGGRTPCL
ncbi:MAG: short-chain dehydrogenase [Zetaproteobacteria bacterium]|nr:short-chain dehydrogenase [Pseudobdellovibrionaceae bacterium]